MAPVTLPCSDDEPTRAYQCVVDYAWRYARSVLDIPVRVLHNNVGKATRIIETVDLTDIDMELGQTASGPGQRWHSCRRVIVVPYTWRICVTSQPA